MTRQTLIAAIRVGQKRGGSPDQIADAIETALEIEAAGGGGGTPDPMAEPPAADHGEIPIAPEAIEAIPDLKVVPDPVDAPASSLIVVAGEDDLKRELENRDRRVPVRLRSLDASASRRVLSMEEAIRFWEENSPPTIQILPEGRDEPLVLDRNIRAMPGMATRGMKPVHFVKLCYKHPSVEDGMEASFSSSTDEIGPGLDLNKVMDKIISDARVIYRPRTPRITPQRPTPIGWGDFAGGIQEGTPEDQELIAQAVKSGGKEQLRERILRS